MWDCDAWIEWWDPKIICPNMKIQRICPKGEDFEEKIDNEKGIRYCPKLMTHESYGFLKVDDNNKHIKIDIDNGFFAFQKLQNNCTCMVHYGYV